MILLVNNTATDTDVQISHLHAYKIDDKHSIDRKCMQVKKSTRTKKAKIPLLKN